MALDQPICAGRILHLRRAPECDGYVIDPADNKFGQSTDTYWVARFLLDEETPVIARLTRSR